MSKKVIFLTFQTHYNRCDTGKKCLTPNTTCDTMKIKVEGFHRRNQLAKECQMIPIKLIIQPGEKPIETEVKNALP